MNKREALLQQLRELESEEPAQPETQESESKSQDFASIFDPDSAKNLPPLPPRYLTEQDCEDHSKGFRIGGRYINSGGKKEFRQAYPRPSYADAGGKPGDLITNGLTREYFRLDIQWYHRATDLESCIGWTRQKLIAQGHLDGCAWLNGSVTDWEESVEKRRLAETWTFLQGLWIGRGMQPVTESQLEKWALGEE